MGDTELCQFESSQLSLDVSQRDKVNDVEPSLFTDDLFEAKEEKRTELEVEVEEANSLNNSNNTIPTFIIPKSKTKLKIINKMIPIELWPYRCKFCGKCFISDTSLTKHVKTHNEFKLKSDVQTNEPSNTSSSKNQLQCINSTSLTLDNPISCLLPKLHALPSTTQEKYVKTYGKSKSKYMPQLTDINISSSAPIVGQLLTCSDTTTPTNNEGMYNTSKLTRIQQTSKAMTAQSIPAVEPFQCENSSAFTPDISNQYLLPKLDVFSDSVLSRHIRTYSKSKPLKRDMEIASLQVILKPEFHVCSVCGDQFKSKSKLKDHFKTHPRQISTCEICGKSFRLQKAFKKHLLSHSLKFQCSVCNKVFSTKNYLTTHILQVHKKPFKCKKCFKGFGFSTQLKHHEARHSELRPFKCDTCDKGFATKSLLSYHNKQVHSKMYLCKHCGKSYGSSTTLMYHERTHEGIFPFACKVCGSAFETRDRLHRHEIRWHFEKKYPCNICEKMFATPNNVKKHKYIAHYCLVKNTILKPHVCRFCGKDFVIAAKLLQHQVTHLRKSHLPHSKGPFKCTQCGKEYLHKPSLWSHMNIHFKKFVCRTCNKYFATNVELKVHNRIHTGEKPFSCHLCGKRFRQKPHLDIHLVVHSGKRTFICDICGASYYCKPNLAYHISLHFKS